MFDTSISWVTWEGELVSTINHQKCWSCHFIRTITFKKMDGVYTNYKLVTRGGFGVSSLALHVPRETYVLNSITL